MSRIVVLIGGAASLNVSYLLLFAFLLLSTERALVPWDMWGMYAPPPGNWQRELNDFFNQVPGLYLPTLIVLGLSFAFFVRGLLRNSSFATQCWLPFVFAAINMIFMIIGFFLVHLSRLPDLWLQPARTGLDVGYHRTWPDILGMTLCMALLLWSQARLALNAERLRRSQYWKFWRVIIPIIGASGVFLMLFFWIESLVLRVR